MVYDFILAWIHIVDTTNSTKATSRIELANYNCTFDKWKSFAALKKINSKFKLLLTFDGMNLSETYIVSKYHALLIQPEDTTTGKKPNVNTVFVYKKYVSAKKRAGLWERKRFVYWTVAKRLRVYFIVLAGFGLYLCWYLCVDRMCKCRISVLFVFVTQLPRAY